MKQKAPWTAYAQPADLGAKIGPEWGLYHVRFQPTARLTDGRLTLGLGGSLPSGAKFEFQPLSWQRFQSGGADELSVDVGNIIFDQGQLVGVKKWKRDDLKQAGDYWYDRANWQVHLFSERNPAEVTPER